MNFVSKINGIEVYTDKNLVVNVRTVDVPRTWKERLFSRPFRPFQKLKQETLADPDPTVYVLNAGRIHGKVVCHPEVYKVMKEAWKVHYKPGTESLLSLGFNAQYRVDKVSNKIAGLDLDLIS